MTRLLAIALAVFAAACSAPAALRTPPSMDASNAQAPESPAAALPTALAPGETAVAERDAGATVYSCPMHPEVVATQPGRCPRCGMNLTPGGAVVPATETQEHPAEHHHGSTEAGHP